jgi:hypothetical protein
MSFPSPHLERERDLPTQYTEPLPDWVREELGAHRDKLPELRQAICNAIAKTKGVLAKGEKNKEQGYFYMSYGSILESVRDAMASEGITIEHVSCDIEAEFHFPSARGTQTVWKWRAVCLVTHSSGAAVARIIRTMTPPSNKAAGHARTGVDRLLTTTLMRIAGGKDDQPSEDDGADRRALGGDQRNRERTRNNHPGNPPPAGKPGTQAQDGPQNGATPGSSSGPPKAQHKDWSPAELEQAKQFADMVVLSIAQTSVAARMVTWARVANGMQLPKVERERVTDAWRKRVDELSLHSEELKKDVQRLGALPWVRVSMDVETGDMHDKLDGTLL